MSCCASRGNADGNCGRRFYYGVFVVSICLVIVITAAGYVRAQGFIDLPIGLDAREIVKRQFENLFPGKSIGGPDNCMRGEARPWFEKTDRSIVSQNFRRATLVQSVEAVVTAAGETLRIISWGCEYYVVSLRYDFAAKQPKPENRKWWYSKAAEALLLAHKLGAHAVFDLETDARFLLKLLNREPVPKEILEVPVEGDGVDFLQTRLSVKRYGALPKGSGSFIEMELYKGPL